MWGQGWHQFFSYGAAGVFQVTRYMVWVSIIWDLVAAHALQSNGHGPALLILGCNT